MTTSSMERPASFNDGAPGGTTAGFAIPFCALVTIVAVAHHPTVSARAPAQAMEAMVRIATVDRVVHGTLIAIVAVLLYGFTVLSLRRGLRRDTSVAGLVAYAIGVVALIGAGLIDGFLFPALAERYAGAPAEAANAAAPVLAASAAMVQMLTKLGLVAMSAGVACWSADLVATPGVLRAIGALGFVSGIATVGVVAFAGHLNPHSLSAIVVVQAVWYLAVSALLVRGRV